MSVWEINRFEENTIFKDKVMRIFNYTITNRWIYMTWRNHKTRRVSWKARFTQLIWNGANSKPCFNYNIKVNFINDEIFSLDLWLKICETNISPLLVTDISLLVTVISCISTCFNNDKNYFVKEVAYSPSQ